MSILFSGIQRMESTYRTWIHAKKDVSSTWNLEELRRDLRTALGTTKWQVILLFLSFLCVVHFVNVLVGVLLGSAL